MKKSIFNQSALKKAAGKKALLYNYTDNNIVIVWNASGTFVFKINTYLFDIEIKNNIPTEQKEIPQCIFDTFAAFTDSNILSETFLTIDLPDNYTARIYQNYKYKYLTLVNTELLKIINGIEHYTPYQYKENRAILYKNGDINCLIFPLYNRGIKDKLIKIAEELKTE